MKSAFGRKGSSITEATSVLPSIRNISTISNNLSVSKRRPYVERLLSPVSFTKEEPVPEEEELHRTIQFTGFEPDVDLPPPPPRDPTKGPELINSPRFRYPSFSPPVPLPARKSMLGEVRKRLNNTELKARIAYAAKHASTR